jgi:diguanylate cyclase (GGDEF)-like protein
MKSEFYDKRKRSDVYGSIYKYKLVSLCILIALAFLLIFLMVRDRAIISEFSKYAAPSFLIVVGVCIIFFILSILLDFYILNRTVSIGKRLTKLAYIDKLTGLPNRYSCDILIDSFADAERLQKAGFILMQIKNLNAVNADSGHDNGNYLIAEFCAFLEEVAENYGYVGRNGGNEFIVLLENCDSTSADMFLLDLTKRIHGYNEMNVGTPLEVSYARVLNIDEHKESISELVSAGYRKLRSMPQTLS